jgi:hypothetical protein
MRSPAEPLERRQRSYQPTSYETHKRRILAGLSEAQRGWERETGARLVVSQTPPYCSYTMYRPKGSRRSAA